MNKRLVSWLLFVLLCIIWGSSFKLMKDGARGLHPLQIAALRIFSAGIVFIPFALFHFSKIPRNKLGTVTLAAVFGNLLPAILFAIAMAKIDGSLGGILNALTPICVVATGILFFKDRIQKNKITGVVIGFTGVALLTLIPILKGTAAVHFNNLVYIWLILIATLLYGVNVNMVGHYLKGVHPVHAATVSLAFMTIPSGILLLQQGFFHLDFSDTIVVHAIGSSIVLGIVCTAIATALFYILVQQSGTVFASLVTYGIPFIAILWGFIDGEQITWLTWLCLAIILSGVYLANKKEKG